jgi:hypothetical protein
MSIATMREHRLKTWPTYFEAIRRGDKRFEIRRNDRDYGVGDSLVLREWDPALRHEGLIEADGYTPRTLRCEITYVMHGGRLGIDPQFCVLGISEPTEEMCYDRF